MILRRVRAVAAAIGRPILHVGLWLVHVALGWKPDEEIGSNTRELVSRGGLATTLVLLALLAVGEASPAWLWIPVLVTTVTLSTIQFFYCICIVFYLAARAGPSDPFHPMPLRLIRDIVFSSFGWILAFAAMFQHFGGIEPSSTAVGDPTFLGHAYFSVVVFTTLGFGDLVPVNGTARSLVSAEALLGNLHLGLLAGAFFYALSPRPA